MKISTEEVLAAIREASPKLGDGFRLVDLADELGVSERTANGYLRQLTKAGQLEVVPMRVHAINGRMVRVMGYRLKAKKR